MSYKIAIIGAGPGGLCLANILQRNNVPFTIFEGDKAPHERNQGGTLDLHPQHGQLAMKEAGLWDEFCEHSRPEADVMKIVKTDGRVLWDGNGPDKHETPAELRRPEIDREKLKDILFKNLLGSDNLKFGMHLKEVVANESGKKKYDLHFKDGRTETGFDLVVGADGAWSKVRKLVTDVLPHYSGVSALELWKTDVEETAPWLSEYIGGGSCFCFAEGRAILMQKLGDGSARTYACLRRPESFMRDCGIDFAGNPQAAQKEYVERYYGDVDAGIKRAMLESDSSIVPRALYMLPVGFHWDHRDGVTLLGDAAHVMTPFAGVGVNAALADAMGLAHSIVKASTSTDDSQDPATLHAAVREYETEMFVRAEMFAQKTYHGLVGHFSEDGGEEFAGRLSDAFAAVEKPVSE